MNSLIKGICSSHQRQKFFVYSGLLKRCSSTSSFIIQSPYKKQQLPSSNIVDFVWSNVEKWPEHTAVLCSKSGKSYKFGELRKACKDFGAGMLTKLSPGATVGLIMLNCPEFIIAMLGCLEAGLIISPLNPNYGPVEIKHQLTDSGAEWVLAHPSKVGSVKLACPGIPILAIGEDSTVLDEVVSSGKGKSLPPLADPGSLAILPYSSGTTGLPKGVRLTHSNIVSNVVQFDHPETRMPHQATKEFQEVNPCVLPFFHIYGFTIGMIMYLFKGAKTIAIPKFEPQSFIDVLNTQKPTMLHLVPPLVQFLAAHPEVTSKTLSNVRMASNGAAPMSPAVAEQFLGKLNPSAILISGFGTTEASPAIATCRNTESDVSSVGCAVSNSEIKVVNIETGEIQDPTIDGEVCCRGPQVMQGYHNNDEATQATIKDGWLHTGDIGHIAKDGKLYLVDRLKELIKVKGFQVAPVELEKVLLSHSGVADTGVIGVPHERTGETPVAFIVPSSKVQASDKELLDFLASKITSSHKRISKIIRVKEIPRNASGKILRRLLKKKITSNSEDVKSN